MSEDSQNQPRHHDHDAINNNRETIRHVITTIEVSHSKIHLQGVEVSIEPKISKPTKLKPPSLFFG